MSAGGAAPPLIEARAVGREVPDGAGWLLRGVDLRLRPGDRLVVTGPSGAGKSLLLRLLALLDVADEGAIFWRGQRIEGSDIPRYRARVAYVQQRVWLEEGRAEDSLRAPFAYRVHLDRSFDRGRAVELLRRLGRPPVLLGRRREDLSGGEALSIALVRALVLEPEVLLLDEPTSSLDAEARRRAREVIEGWASERPAERAVLWVTHDPRLAEGFATRRGRVGEGGYREGESDDA